MGLRGPIGKPDDRRQRRNRLTPLVLGGSSVTPTPPPGLLKVTKQRWETYWASDLAKATREAHLPMIERLFQLYDERDRWQRQVRKDGYLDHGSTGQTVPHALLKLIVTADSRILALEDRLGLSPKAMANLGASWASAQKSLDDVNREIVSGDEDDTEADPRLAVG